MQFLKTFQASQSLFLVLLLLINLFGTQLQAQPAPTALQLLIVEGDGAINNVKQRVNRETIVQVEDENHRPVAGAAVIFFLPNQGPGGTFENGSTTFTSTTNAQGQATVRGIRFNNLAGPMQMRITASFGGQTASLIVNQTNVVGAGAAGATASTGMSAATKWLIIIAAAGGAAAAGGIALGRGGGNSPTPTVPSVTVTAGAPTVGAPQ